MVSTSQTDAQFEPAHAAERVSCACGESSTNIRNQKPKQSSPGQCQRHGLGNRASSWQCPSTTSVAFAFLVFLIGSFAFSLNALLIPHASCEVLNSPSASASRDSLVINLDSQSSSQYQSPGAASASDQNYVKSSPGVSGAATNNILSTNSNQNGTTTTTHVQNGRGRTHNHRPLFQNNRISSTLFLPSYFENGNKQSTTTFETQPGQPVKNSKTPPPSPTGSGSSSGPATTKFRHQQLGTVSMPDRINYQSPFTWTCKDGVSCVRQLRNSTGSGSGGSGNSNTSGSSAASDEPVSLNVCWLTCGAYGALWPVPTVKTVLTKTVTPFYPQNVEVTNIYAPSALVKSMLGFAGNGMLDTLFRMHPSSEGNSMFPSSSDGKKIEFNIVTISLTTQNAESKLGLSTDESYTLTIAPYYEGQGQRLHVEINGASYYGVRHGLETLSQLIAYDDINDCLQIVSQAIIHDQPVFPYRGLMIDTARNFIPIKHLKRMVDAMSQNKLNVLHWHLTDTNSFPFYSKSVPQMTKYGAYSRSQIYTPSEIKEFVLYSRLKGVKVLPELDAPAHAGNGWQWGPLEGLGDLAMCINAEPWRSWCGQPPCGQLNPLNRFTYIILGEIYKDMLEVFDNDLFHMGGDEIYFQCWSMDPTVQAWQRNHSTYDLMQLWGFFQDSAFDKLKEANNGNPITPIVWTSDMTTRGRQFLNPQEYVIQVWSTSTSYDIKELLNEKYRLIFSNLESVYLDHGFGTWLGKEHFYQFKTWQELYDNDLKSIVDYHLGANNSREVFRSGQILGGEATLWAEKVDEFNMEMKLWPRSSAFAERLWSHPAKRSDSVYPRLLHHRQRMVKRGVHADRLQPESCHQISGYCDDPFSRI